MAVPAERIPVIIGVGEVNDRPADDEQGLDSAELMIAALEAADEDAGGGWIARCDALLVVPQLSFEMDVPAALAAATGIAPEAISEAPIASGDTPVRLLNDAANAIAGGEATVCAIAGGEALRTAMRRDSSGPIFKGSLATASELRRKYGLINPGEIYPFYENALRPALGQTLEEGQAESALIWSKMSQVAESADGAWLRKPLSPEEIATPSASNRPIAFPYTKLMVANSSVNQGAAVFVTSLAQAREAGVPEDRIVYVGAGAAAHELDEPLTRAEWTNTPSMPVSIEKALELNGVSAAELDHVELYSCFPCVPKMARRILGWPADRPVTVHGGLTFGGGPIGNYMTHAIAAMVRALRRQGRAGLLFANGGHCSHNHSMVLTRDPPSKALFPQDYHYQDLADAQRGAIPPLTDEYEGQAPVETYTVIYNRSGEPSYGIVLSRAPTGERVVARVEPDDERSIAFLTDGRAEPVGHIGTNRRVGDVLVWNVD